MQKRNLENLTKSQIPAGLVVDNDAEDYGFDIEGDVEIIKDESDGDGKNAARGEIRDCRSLVQAFRRGVAARLSSDSTE